MALTGKYIGIDRVLEGIFRDYGWTHEVDWADALEWTGEILDMIAVPQQYLDKVTDGNLDLNHPCPIGIDKYRGLLPCDMIYPVQVRDNATKVPLRYSSDTFHGGLEKMEEGLPASPATTSPFGSIVFSSPFIATQGQLRDTCTTDLTYTINGCYIFTNFKTGALELVYKAFPMDENGQPLIPDNVKYTQAIKAYIAEKIGQKMFMQGKLDGQRFGHLQKERDWYVGAATTSGLMPTIDQLESWKNQFVRLIPQMNAHGTGFKYYGDPSTERTINSY
jgi:hypothetical protein